MEIRLLRADEIDVRISTCNQYGVGLLLYKDARCDMNILDETFGPMNWQRKHELINGNLFCAVGIFDNRVNQWVWKQDVGVESYTEKEKGQASDAFKRACFNWGIGRELYTAPHIFVYAENLNKHEQRGQKWTCTDSFKVVKVEYQERKISYLVIKNLKTNMCIEFGQPSVKPNVQIASESQIKALEGLINRKGLPLNEVLQKANVKSLQGITNIEYNRIVRTIQGM